MHVRASDRRVEPRLDCRGAAIITELGPSGYTLEVVDLSATGLSLVGHALPAIERCFSLVLGLEDIGWIEAEAELVWRRDAGDFTQLGARLRPRRALDLTIYHRALCDASAWPLGGACAVS